MDIEKVDIMENKILLMDKSLLEILLSDRTTAKNILWCTDNYNNYGIGYSYLQQIRVELITGKNGNVIKPRVRKTKKEQKSRIKDKAEVFTSSWACNHQNNHIDSLWFGRDNVFNIEKNEGWEIITDKVGFDKLEKTWQDYVSDKRLEISCGEAPYIVSRYDTVTGEILEPIKRIGILDRKIRVINENANNDDWFFWVKNAYQSVYGYEWQGDSLLIARENLLYSFLDYHYEKFQSLPSLEMQREIAEIISWNFWQMDGLKGVVPLSCDNEKIIQVNLFGEDVTVQCEGCKYSSIKKHDGIYCLIKEWTDKKGKPKVHRYIDLFDKGVI